MKNILTIKNVRGYLDEYGTAHLNVEDVSRELGFTQIKNEVEYVRWETVNGYLFDLGFSQQVGKDNYIPENIVYKLCFKASNETARKFQDVVCDEILPTIRKTGTYSTRGYNKKSTSVGEVASMVKTLTTSMRKQGSDERKVAKQIQLTC
ncbi:MAG: hypothetical protein FWG63_00170, partial [Defluviitaleaceae bacterium]|nr:hypothetical protein [Defluviitaleaceae bacterium]